MPRPVLTPGHVRQCRLALKLRQSDLAAALGVAPQTISCWEHGTRTIPAMVDLALEALEWRARATRGPPDDATGDMLARSADRPHDDVLETEITVTPFDDDIAEQLQAFNQEVAEYEWHASVTLPKSGQVCLRIVQGSEGIGEPVPHALEIFRRTFEAAAKSARTHIVPRQE